MDKELIGRKFLQETSGEKSEDGFWSVTVTIKEIVTYTGEDAREESISAMGIDSDFDSANTTALRSVLMWLEEYVYAKGFTGLVEAANFYKEKEQNGSKALDNTTNKTKHDGSKTGVL